MRFHLAEKLLPFESIFEKTEENDFPLEEIRTFLNIGLLIAILVFKNVNERLSFLLNRKSFATGCNEGFT